MTNLRKSGIVSTAVMLTFCMSACAVDPAEQAEGKGSESADNMTEATDTAEDPAAETAEDPATDTTAVPADDPDVAAAPAAAVDLSRTIAVGPRGGNGSAEATWRDYGNGYVQFKSGVCKQNLKIVNSCKYVLRADGGRTTFHTWPMPFGKKVVNGKYTIAKSRHPYIKVFVKPPVGSSYIGYIHLY